MRFILACLMFALPIASLAGPPRIHSIVGEGKAVLWTPRGQIPLKKGMELERGDHVKTDESVSVKIEFSDGSIVLVGRSSDFEVQSGKFREGVPYNDLHFGKVRGIIKKSKEENQKKVHFIIRSKVAVLGVRGTDFIADKNEKAEEMELHTLEGSVDLAKNTEEMYFGKGVSVSAGEYSRASAKENLGSEFN